MANNRELSQFANVVGYNGGNIGIGTDNPSAPIHLSGADANAAKIKIEDNNNGFAASEIGVENGGRDLKIDAPQDIYFEDVDTGEKHLYIENGGNIGIGSANPAYSLDLGESPSTIRLVSENNGTAIRIGAGDNGNSDVTLLRVDGGSGQHDGESDSSAYGFSIKYMGTRSGNNNSLSIFGDDVTAGTQVEAITINQDGSTGIGTDNPTEKLEIRDGGLLINGSNLTGIEVGISTEALVKTNGQTASLDLSKDDHKVTATGTVTIDVTGGTEASNHTLRVVNSGIATVGFSTYFLFPSGGTPVLPTTSGAISLISFTVHRAGAVGVSTQLLSGSSVNFS